MLNSEKVKDKLTEENIIDLCCYLQGDDIYYRDADGHLMFSTYICHGGDSRKLYYYQETKLFYCFTCGSSYDVFELVKRAKKFDTFREAFDFVVQYFHLKNTGFEDDTEKKLIDDWDIFQQIEDYEKEEQEAEPIQVIQENLLEYFYPMATPVEWIKDGISPEVMKYFGIRIDTCFTKIIIPHRDIDGNLIGIRGRSYNPVDLNNGCKYMPVMIEGEMYRHPLGRNLFGLYENKETIKKLKKVFVAEAEKSVLQLASMYGVDNCWAVATCGSNFTENQMNLLLSLGVTEIILGYDREFDGKKGDQDTIEYEQKLLKIVSPLLPYVNISIIMDYDHLLPQKKMSPTDYGRETFEKLYKQRIRLYSYEAKTKKRGK